MPKTDVPERTILDAFEKGTLPSVATKSELAKFEAAARATATKGRPPVGAKRAPTRAAKRRTTAAR